MGRWWIFTEMGDSVWPVSKRGHSWPPTKPQSLRGNFAMWRRVAEGNNRFPSPGDHSQLPPQSPPQHNVQRKGFLCRNVGGGGNKKAVKEIVEGKLDGWRGGLRTFQGEGCLWSQLGLITITKEGSYRATSLRCSGVGARVGPERGRVDPHNPDNQRKTGEIQGEINASALITAE